MKERRRRANTIGAFLLIGIMLTLGYSFLDAPLTKPDPSKPFSTSFKPEIESKAEVRYLNTTYEENVEAIKKINAIRGSYGIAPLEPYRELYELAYFRAKDMHNRNYFDHITPEGKDVGNFRAQFGISVANPIGENLQELNPSYPPYNSIDFAISSWMDSTKGHRENLLEETDRRGAIACYYTKCVFLGAR